MEGEDHGVGGSSGDGEMALVQGVDAQRRVEADGLAGGAHLALRRRHRHLAERGETRLERAKPWRVDAVIVGDQNALRCQNSLRHYHTLARGRKGAAIGEQAKLTSEPASASI